MTQEGEKHENPKVQIIKDATEPPLAADG